MRNTNVKNEKGITLIVLVITVVILFILSLLVVDFTVDGKLFKTANELGAKGEAQQTETETLRNSWKDMLGLTNTTTNNNTTGNTTGDNTTGGETTCTHTSTTATDNGDGTHTITCTNCGKQITTEKHNYVNRKCTKCGAQKLAVAGEKTTETLEFTDSDGNKAIIPKGFTVSGISTEQSVDGGLVIYDIPEGRTVNWTNPDSVKTQYNQFVWIPVEVNKTTEPKDTETSIASFKRSVWQDNARVANNAQSSTSFPSSSYSWSNYTEPYSKDSSDYDGTGTGKTGISAQITELTKSIYKYGGFYIGRYEAGSTKERTSSSLQTEPFVVQQDKYPYNYVKWGDSMNNIGTTGAVYLSNSLYTGKTGYGVKSMLCTGAAWDSMLDFVKDSNHSVTDSTTWGNYKNSETFEITRGSYAVLNTSSYTLGSFNNVESNYSKMKGKSILLTTGATGATERNSSKNIYDVAGNCYEWTTEAYDASSRVVRGGSYNLTGSNFPASFRRSNIPTDSDLSYFSFRPLLYVAL